MIFYFQLFSRSFNYFQQGYAIRIYTKGSRYIFYCKTRFNTGNVATNTKLSLLRANAVVNYLVTKGINKKRLSAKGFGPSVSVAPNTTKEGRAQNRRVEMKVLE